jgi:hypothetical protein
MSNIVNIDIDSIIRGDRGDLSEYELGMLYIYLDMNLPKMTEQEKVMWYEILEKIDPDEK